MRTITWKNSLGTVIQYSYIFFKFVGVLIKQFNLFEKDHAVLPPPPYTMLTLGKTTLFVEWREGLGMGD